MISLRQHAISLVAVFLALAVGVVLGSGFVADTFGSSSDAQDKREQELRDENQQLTNNVNAANNFDTAIAGRLLEGTLRDRPVLIVTTPGADEGDVAAVKDNLNKSGAVFNGQLALTDEFVSDQNAEKIGSIIDQSIPAGSTLRTELTDSGGRAGDLLGLLLQLSPRDAEPQVSGGDTDAGLAALKQGGFVDYADGAIEPAQLAIIVTGNKFADDSGARGQVVARFAAAFSERGAGTVLVGRTGSAEGSSPIAVVRADPALNSQVSTVDNVDQATGRITTVLALADELGNKQGAYGTGPGATAIAPES
ncbi:MAG: channel protein [Gordonia sp.]|uniref:Copper transporter n=1 Tax=Gordonia rubripertincta TaxID=36822 RepID=A0ABT4MVK8_GORRU|nr:copper transporter [Gordonia rubripertincta]MBA4021159.1 channel protein [Gordonia sp. (in: high G+C Gram-positive bacteria)]MCZ4550997.1 copper transporter [Gordonia rubripertincta]